MESRAAEAEKKVQEMRGVMDAAEAAARAARSEVERATKELEDFKNLAAKDVGELEAANGELDGKLAAATARATAADAEVAKLTQQLDAVREGAGWREKVQAAEGELQQLQQQLGALVLERDQARLRSVQVEHQFAAQLRS
jgi:chromosome segregation ATPase